MVKSDLFFHNKELCLFVLVNFMDPSVVLSLVNRICEESPRREGDFQMFLEQELEGARRSALSWLCDDLLYPGSSRFWIGRSR